MLHMSMLEAIQLLVGAMMGAGVVIELELHGLSLWARRTCLPVLGVIVCFALTYLWVTDWIMG